MWLLHFTLSEEETESTFLWSLTVSDSGVVQSHEPFPTLLPLLWKSQAMCSLKEELKKPFDPCNWTSLCLAHTVDRLLHVPSTSTFQDATVVFDSNAKTVSIVKRDISLVLSAGGCRLESPSATWFMSNDAVTLRGFALYNDERQLLKTPSFPRADQPPVLKRSTPDHERMKRIHSLLAICSSKESSAL